MADKQTFIGKQVRIIDATNKSYIGLSGVIIDETKNSFVIRNELDKRVLKAGCKFDVDGDVVIGDNITKRIEDRIKSR